MCCWAFIIFFITVLSIAIEVNVLGLKSSETTKGKDHISCSSINNNKDDNFYCRTKPNRYFLFDVNPGEGFNLRRDIYVRISPLINKLNREDNENQWILVLPPWGRLPHWKSNTFFTWDTFFDLEKIKEFVPAIELNQFLENFGLDNPLDIVFQLQHFPFDKVNSDWKEKIELAAQCQQRLKYQLDERIGLYFGHFWKSGIFARKAECMTLRGQASTLFKFLIESNYKSVMFDRAEVILWDNYGEHDWWQARKSLQFSKNLVLIAEQFLKKILPNFDKNLLSMNSISTDFIGVHLRRKDFLSGREEKIPSIQGAASQIFKLFKMLGSFTIFIATDESDKEIRNLYYQLNEMVTEENIGLLKFLQFKDESLSEGQVAIVDQIICSWSNYFIGTPDSTFTLRIFEEREILGLDENTTFNYFCPDYISISTPCKVPTRWKVKH